MSFCSPLPENPHPSTLLLREVVDVLSGELSALSNRQWDDLPELKKKKVVLASRLRDFDWMPDLMDREPSELMLLKSRVTDLEMESRQKIQVQRELIENQILALQELHQFCLECLNVSFQKIIGTNPSP